MASFQRARSFRFVSLMIVSQSAFRSVISVSYCQFDLGRRRTGCFFFVFLFNHTRIQPYVELWRALVSVGRVTSNVVAQEVASYFWMLHTITNTKPSRHF